MTGRVLAAETTVSICASGSSAAAASDSDATSTLPYSPPFINGSTQLLSLSGSNISEAATITVNVAATRDISSITATDALEVLTPGAVMTACSGTS